MKPFVTTWKWEGLKTFHTMMPFCILAAIFLALLWLLPVPREATASLARDVLDFVFSVAGVSALTIGFSFVVIYPTFNLAVLEFRSKELLLKRGSGFPYGYGVLARVGLNVLVAAAGLVIVAAAFGGLGRLYPVDSVILGAMVNAGAGGFLLADWVNETMLGLLFSGVIELPALLLFFLTTARSERLKGGWLLVPMWGLACVGIAFNGAWLFGAFSGMPLPLLMLGRMALPVFFCWWACWHHDHVTEVMTA